MMDDGPVGRHRTAASNYNSHIIPIMARSQRAAYHLLLRHTHFLPIRPMKCGGIEELLEEEFDELFA